MSSFGTALWVSRKRALLCQMLFPLKKKRALLVLPIAHWGAALGLGFLLYVIGRQEIVSQDLLHKPVEFLLTFFLYFCFFSFFLYTSFSEIRWLVYKDQSIYWVAGLLRKETWPKAKSEIRIEQHFRELRIVLYCGRQGPSLTIATYLVGYGISGVNTAARKVGAWLDIPICSVVTTTEIIQF